MEAIYLFCIGIGGADAFIPVTVAKCKERAARLSGCGYDAMQQWTWQEKAEAAQAMTTKVLFCLCWPANGLQASHSAGRGLGRLKVGPAPIRHRQKVAERWAGKKKASAHALVARVETPLLELQFDIGIKRPTSGARFTKFSFKRRRVLPFWDWPLLFCQPKIFWSNFFP